MDNHLLLARTSCLCWSDSYAQSDEEVLKMHQKMQFPKNQLPVIIVHTLYHVIFH